VIYGVARLIEEVRALGYEVREATGQGGEQFAVIAPFTVSVGRFVDRVIELGLQATADFPRTASSAIHVRAAPHLYDLSDSVQNVRNIQASALGAEWRYWSHNFGWERERNARHLMTQINAVFLNAS